MRSGILALVALATLAPSTARAYLDVSFFERPATEGGGGGRFFTGAPADGYGCYVCHRDGTPAPLAVLGIPDEGWDPGALYEFTVELPETGNSTAVIEIADDAGEGVGAMTVVPDEDLTDADRCSDGSAANAPVPIPGRLVARARVCGARQVRVRWTAPPTIRTDVRVFAAMVAGNGSGDPSGDGATVSSFPLRARGAPDIEGARLSARCSIGGERDRSLLVGVLAALAIALARRWRGPTITPP